MDPELSQPPHKPLSIRREHKAQPTDLRTLYRHSAFDRASGESNCFHPASGVPATPVLPPTPPAVSYEAHIQGHNESSEVMTHRSSARTPLNQHSPPTPDNTPPRHRRLLLQPPILGTQLSLVSTHAESFKTAAEDFTSDTDSLLSPDPQYHNHSTHVPHRQLSNVYPLGLSTIGQPPVHPYIKYVSPNHRDINTGTNMDHLANPKEKHEYDQVNIAGVSAEYRAVRGFSSKDITRKQECDEDPERVPLDAQHAEYATSPIELHIGAKLRDSPKEAEEFSTSTSAEKLASIIGWTQSVDPELNDYRRASGMSTTSTIGAIVLDSSPLLGRRTTLRKTTKNISLRSASSPLPDSMRASQVSSNDSPHRLVHKKARLSNENRLSFGSEPSRSHNMASNTVLPKIEVIKVAVIPERSSSLQSSAASSRRHSLSGTSYKTQVSKSSNNAPPSSWQQKRTASESQDKVKEHQQPIVMPPRNLSLSAPPSSSTSRANSMTSMAFRVQRQKAEKDLRKTLDLERVPTVISNHNLPDMSIMGELDAHQPHVIATQGASEWAALRAPSVLCTPFSQPSYQSASPEINEATAVNIFPHNNHSVQIIESNLAQESRAVQTLRRDRYMKNEAQSPLRNPRPPPLPPKFSVVSASFGTELDQQHGSGEFGSARRTPLQQRTESLAKALGRGMSLKNAKNRKASQDLDSDLYPFWRPRPFWVDVDSDVIPSAADQDYSVDQSGSVSNSLGFPQPDTVLSGPASLIRRISRRRRRNRAVEKQTSQSSLSRLRTSQNLYKNPLLGINLRLIGIREIEQRILFAKQKKEDEKREKRRAALPFKLDSTQLVPNGVADARWLPRTPPVGHKRNASAAELDSTPVSPDIESPDRHTAEDVQGKKKPVKRACNECRQQKVRGHITLDGPVLVTRSFNMRKSVSSSTFFNLVAVRLRLECKIEDHFKRIGKRSRNAEMEREIVELRKQVSEQATILRNAGLSSPSAANGAHPTTQSQNFAHDAAAGLLDLRSGLDKTASNAGSILKRLGPVALTAERVRELHQRYFTLFHPFLPFLNPERTPDEYYQRSPLLFWVMMSVGARHYGGDPDLFSILCQPLAKLTWEIIADVPQNYHVVKALILLCAWPLPTSSTSTDPTFMYCGLMVQIALQIGLHRPSHAQDFSKFRIELRDAELQDRVVVWSVCNIVAQRIATAYGQPPLTIYDWTLGPKPIENNPGYELPAPILNRLLIEKFVDRVTRSLYMDDKDPVGLTTDKDRGQYIKLLLDHLEHLEDQLRKDTSPITKIHLKAAVLHMRLSAFFSPPHLESYREDLLELYHATTEFLEACLGLETESSVSLTSSHSHGLSLSYGTNYIFYMMLAAGFSLLKLMHNFLSQHELDTRGASDLLTRTLFALRSMSVSEDDLAERLAEVLAQVWKSGRVRAEPSHNIGEQSLLSQNAAIPVDMQASSRIDSRDNGNMMMESNEDAPIMAAAVVPGMAGMSTGMLSDCGIDSGQANYEVFDPLNWMLDGIVDFPYNFNPATGMID
ncbi:hypothetical protein DV736_g2566, partial [Chaetothyriales sp. CBS 134916]